MAKASEAYLILRKISFPVHPDSRRANGKKTKKTLVQ